MYRSPNNNMKSIRHQILAGLIAVAATHGTCQQVQASIFVTGIFSGNVAKVDETTGAFLGNVTTGHHQLSGIAADSQGNLWVGKYGGAAEVYHYSPDGTLLSTTDAISGGGTLSQLAIGPDGNIYAPDFNQNAVARFSTSTGAYLGALGSGVIGQVSGGLAIESNGRILVGDYSNSSIRELDPTSGALLRTIGAGQAYNVVSLAVDASGDIFSAGVYGDIHKFSSSGSLLASASASNGNYDPLAGAAFGPDGLFYVSEQNTTGNILRFNPSTLAEIGVFTNLGSNISGPSSLAWSSASSSGAPEPATLMLAGVALACVVRIRRRTV